MRRDKVATLAFDLSKPTLDCLQVRLNRVFLSEARSLGLDDLRLSQHRLHPLPDGSINDAEPRSCGTGIHSGPGSSCCTGEGATRVILDLHDEAAIAATDIASPEERRLRVAVVADRCPLVDREPFLRSAEHFGEERGRGDTRDANSFVFGAKALERLPLTLSTLHR